MIPNQKIMKMKKIILRAMLATLVITAATASIGFLNNSFAAKAEIRYGYPDGTGGVWNRQVLQYLTAYDYTAINIYYIDANGNRYCTSSNHPGYYTIVHVSAGA